MRLRQHNYIFVNNTLEPGEELQKFNDALASGWEIVSAQPTHGGVHYIIAAPKEEGSQANGPIAVTVNGRNFEYERSVSLGYHAILDLATEGKYDPTAVYTVTYSERGGVSGSLTEEETVTITNGMVINCHITGNA